MTPEQVAKAQDMLEQVGQVRYFLRTAAYFHLEAGNVIARDFLDDAALKRLQAAIEQEAQEALARLERDLKAIGVNPSPAAPIT